jgi:uncharacterized protein
MIAASRHNSCGTPGVLKVPKFKYHPDPIATGSIGHSDAECRCCGQSRGLIYLGGVYAIEELTDCICPWCIADGSAHAKFDAEFSDATGVGDYVKPSPVSPAIVEEVASRTPGFTGWQLGALAGVLW